MYLGEFISDLLYRHDCVVVPNFGAFIAQKTTAKINYERNEFYPPKKNITFNCGTGVKTQIIELINFYEKVLKIKFKIKHKLKPKSDPNSIIASTKLFKKLFKNYKMTKVKNIKNDLSKSFLKIKR